MEKRYAVYKNHLGIETECFTPFPYLSKTDAEIEKDKLNDQYHYPYAGTEFTVVEMDVSIYPEKWVNPSPTLSL